MIYARILIISVLKSVEPPLTKTCGPGNLRNALFAFFEKPQCRFFVCFFHVYKHRTTVRRMQEPLFMVLHVFLPKGEFMNIQDRFIRALKEEMKRKGWSVKDLALRSGLSARGIDYYLTRQRLPRIDAAERIARALKIPLSQLLDTKKPSANNANEPDIEAMIHISRALDKWLKKYGKHIPPKKYFGVVKQLYSKVKQPGDMPDHDTILDLVNLAA